MKIIDSGLFPTRLLIRAEHLLMILIILIPGAVYAEKSGIMEFALIGDTPYQAAQEKEFNNLMQTLNSEELAFVVHDGDMWFDGIAWKDTSKGLPPCSDAAFEDRLKLAQSSKHPFILTPGDNDWTDCYRAKPQAYDPLERLDKLRKMYFQGDRSLGQQTIKLKRQSDNPRYARYRENVSWQWDGVQFMTLHMVGSNNNLGRTPEMDEEYKQRNEANIEWMHEVFDQARRNGSKAVMIISQANPYFENTWAPILQKRYMLKGMGIKPPKERRSTGFDDFLDALEEETVAFGKPVVYVHGDTHTFRIDKPLVYSSSPSRFIENFTRVETFGYPNTHWVRVTIDPDDPNVFRFEQEIVSANRVHSR
ncbi:MAG: metallophosphoesterase [Proteobacteria bacterium]|nr:metallophosphoesterase [Pseudomonadota bacterium]